MSQAPSTLNLKLPFLPNDAVEPGPLFSDSALLYKHEKKIFEIRRLGDFNLQSSLESPLYKIIWLTKGKCGLSSDDQIIVIDSGDLLFLTPHFLGRQTLSEGVDGWLMAFHSEFYCLEKHQQEVGCNGILFNDTYRIAPVHADTGHQSIFQNLISNLLEEARNDSPARREAMVAYLKLFLIRAARMKLQQQPFPLIRNTGGDLPEKLTRFQELLEAHFRHERLPRFYARQLNSSSFTLNRLIRKYFKRSVTVFIYDRIILEAKRELYLSDKTIKEISFELGFEDEFYFSRIFKKHTGLSPSSFRSAHTT